MRRSASTLPVRRILAICLLLVLLLSGRALAQNPRGSVRGTVEDASGAVVPSARVTILAQASSVSREVFSDARGEFRVDDLLPGNYKVTVSAKGFAVAESEVSIAVGVIREIAVSLKAETVQQSVSVQGQVSSITTQPIDAASVVQQGVVSTSDLQSIPLAHRSFANIAYLVPGTEPVEPSDPTKARITAVSFGGSSGLNVEMSVDGGDNSDDYIGGFLQNYSVDSIQEFAVRTAQEFAETGRTTGGSVLLTTKRGSDDWHGGAAFYERDASMNARFPIDNPAPEPKQPFSRQNYIGTLGGPIVKSKVWFFSSLEYVHEDASIAYSRSSLDEFQSLASLASSGLIPGISSIPVPNNVPVPFKDFLGTIRVDWAQSEKSQWFLRGAIDTYNTDNDLVQQSTLESTGATSHSNYLNLLLDQHYAFSPTWLGAFVFEASGLHHTEEPNSNLGFGLAFPFSSTSSSISGFETFGDNQFVTPITAFPVLRNQEKYQFRYDVAHTTGRHAPRFGINFIHEPVLSGALAGNAETLLQYPNDPSFYAANPSQFFFSSECASAPPVNSGINCQFTPAANGVFTQNVQRLGLYAEDSWRVTPRLTFNYGLRWDTTFGLFNAEGQSQLANPAVLTLQALQIPLPVGTPHDYRKQFAPRLGVAYSLGQSGNTVVRAGFGLFFNDLAQNGWVTALQAVNTPLAGPCVNPGDPGCIPGGGDGALIDPHYKTPYSVHTTAGIEHAFNSKWTLSADYVHEQGNHGFARYQYIAGSTLFTPIAGAQPDVPNVAIFRSDNRSSYNGLMIHLQANMSRRFNFVANYTLSKAKTWGCVLGELFDYVDGVCNPLHAFGPGDYGPSGEDVTHRFVLAGTFFAPLGFEASVLGQAESARPITLTTPVDVNGTGDPTDDRAVVNGAQTTLDELRGTPYIQVDMRVSRPIHFGERYTLMPFIELFNIFNRNNPGANYVTDISALPTPVNSLTNATAFCLNPACTQTQPITSLNQLKVPSGALGDFFGPGTTVGIPFAAQVGIRFSF